MARVVVGLSGGVDSSVAAYLLKEAGHEVIGLFMKNWLDESVTISDECPWLEDSNDARLVADKLEIPFQVIDLSEAYKDRVVDYMFKEYENGRTPNPDVLCNREIKFDIFLKMAQQLKADFVATGHYCQKDTIKVEGNAVHRLLAGADPNKDQSYFLCQLSQAQLAKALFPIGHLQKPEVREIAASQGLITADKKDSQGLCFIGKVKLPDFLKQQLKAKKGDIIEIASDSTLYANWALADFSQEYTISELEQFVAPLKYDKTEGKKAGVHNGAHFFTLGQRKGIGVGGYVEPLFVLHKDTKNNVLYVGEGPNHKGLMRNVLFMDNVEVSWLREDLKLTVGTILEVEAQIRYRQQYQKAKVIAGKDGLYMVFEKAQSAIAPGQFAAWFIGSELLGSGVITK
jgi:tRNA-specific 2-thiouridylase